MVIALEKAQKILNHYNQDDYNATTALQKAGYAKSTAQHKSKQIINSAIKTVLKENIDEVVTSSNPMASMFTYVGITPADVAREFLKIITQDKDMTNKLKALQPLLATQGIKWNDEKTLNAPTLNLVVKENNALPMATATATETAQQSDIISVAQDIRVQSTLCDTPMATANDLTQDNSDVDINLTPLSPSVPPAQKEGESPTQNFSDLSTIDKKEEVLPVTFTENIVATPTVTPTTMPVEEIKNNE